MRNIELTEDTKVPLGAVVSMIGIFCTLLVGGVFWISTLYADVAQAKRDISSLYESDREKTKILHRLDVGVMRLQEHAGIKVPNDDD